MHGEHEEKPVARPARATVALEPEQRARLGLPDTPSVVCPLPPINEEQWTDSGLVAARVAHVPHQLPSDRGPGGGARQVGPRPPSAGRSGLVIWRRGRPGGSGAKGTAFAGDVVGLITSERSMDRALVDLTIRRSFVNDGAFDPVRIVFSRVTLVRHRLTGHWQVTDLQLS